MGMKIDDSVKQKLLDSLAEEPTMVLSTAYAYAKNYVNYGEDITKAWTTAVQQASIIEKARQQAWVEAYDSFKKEYENRLKAYMVAILENLDLEIDEHSYIYADGLSKKSDYVSCEDMHSLIRIMINNLRRDNESSM